MGRSIIRPEGLPLIPHPGRLADLLDITPGPGDSHHVNWVKVIHFIDQGCSYLFGSIIPNVDNLLVVFLIGDQAAAILFSSVATASSASLRILALALRDFNIRHEMVIPALVA